MSRIESRMQFEPHKHTSATTHNNICDENASSHDNNSFVITELLATRASKRVNKNRLWLYAEPSPICLRNQHAFSNNSRDNTVHGERQSFAATAAFDSASTNQIR
jgi:hypothetical protein